jgi:hypothetical protein
VEFETPISPIKEISIQKSMRKAIEKAETHPITGDEELIECIDVQIMTPKVPQKRIRTFFSIEKKSHVP